MQKVKGAYHTLFNELLNMDQESFRNYMHMDFAAFEQLLSMVENNVLKKDSFASQLVTKGKADFW